MPTLPRNRAARTADQHNLKDELVQAEDADLTNGNTTSDGERTMTWDVKNRRKEAGD